MCPVSMIYLLQAQDSYVTLISPPISVHQNGKKTQTIWHEGGVSSPSVEKLLHTRPPINQEIHLLIT